MAPTQTLVGSLEYGVMLVLWERGSATTRELHERVGEPDGLAYTTIGTVLDRLFAKGFVSRVRSGKTFTYTPLVARDEVDRARAHDTISRLVANDPAPAIVNLVEALESIDPELLEELARVTAARRKARDGS